MLDEARMWQTTSRYFAYTDKHVGSRERVGNKGGTLGSKLRAVMDGSPRSAGLGKCDIIPLPINSFP
jgi:hypothetical protein